VSDKATVTHIDIHVQPRASRTEVVGRHGDAIKIRIAAPPTDGSANEELVRFLAKTLGVKRSAVTIVSGMTSRRKRVAVEGVALEQAVRRLGG
jgi:uncharacterized protein (TIGR00251 family)